MKKSTQVATGGLCSALCLLFMFLTGIIPFATYALPAMAGIVLIAVATENGIKTAWVVYGAVAILSIFIVPDREASLTFIVFFGYYPILKPYLDRIVPAILRVIIKFLLFNTAIIGGYAFTIYVLGLTELMEGMGDMGQFSLLILLVMANIMLILYDFALKHLSILYTKWFRVKYLRKF